MFDLITGRTKHMPSGGPVSVLLSSFLHMIMLSVRVISSTRTVESLFDATGSARRLDDHEQLTPVDKS